MPLALASSPYTRLHDVPSTNSVHELSTTIFGLNYTIALIQCRCYLVPAAAFSAFHFQLFAFACAFQFEQGDQHSPSQTSAGQYSSKKIQLLSRRLPDLICFGGTLFSFELWAKNHQVHDHR